MSTRQLRNRKVKVKLPPPILKSRKRKMAKIEEDEQKVKIESEERKKEIDGSAAKARKSIRKSPKDDPSPKKRKPKPRQIQIRDFSPDTPPLDIEPLSNRDKQPLKCPSCKKIYVGQLNLLTHILESHPQLNISLMLPKSGKQPDGRLRCADCKHTCDTLERLLEHFRDKHAFQKDIDDTVPLISTRIEVMRERLGKNKVPQLQKEVESQKPQAEEAEDRQEEDIPQLEPAEDQENEDTAPALDKFDQSAPLEEEDFDFDVPNLKKSLTCSFCPRVYDSLPDLKKHMSVFYLSCDPAHKAATPEEAEKLTPKPPKYKKITDQGEIKTKLHKMLADQSQKRPVNTHLYSGALNKPRRFTNCDVCNLPLAEAVLALHRSRVHGKMEKNEEEDVQVTDEKEQGEEQEEILEEEQVQPAIEEEEEEAYVLCDCGAEVAHSRLDEHRRLECPEGNEPYIVVTDDMFGGAQEVVREEEVRDMVFEADDLEDLVEVEID